MPVPGFADIYGNHCRTCSGSSVLPFRANITDDAKGVIWSSDAAHWFLHPPYAPAWIMNDTSITHMLCSCDESECHDVFQRLILFHALAKTRYRAIQTHRSVKLRERDASNSRYEIAIDVERRQITLARWCERSGTANLPLVTTLRTDLVIYDIPHAARRLDLLISWHRCSNMRVHFSTLSWLPPIYPEHFPEVPRCRTRTIQPQPCAPKILSWSLHFAPRSLLSSCSGPWVALLLSGMHRASFLRFDGMITGTHNGSRQYTHPTFNLTTPCIVDEVLRQNAQINTSLLHAAQPYSSPPRRSRAMATSNRYSTSISRRPLVRLSFDRRRLPQEATGTTALAKLVLAGYMYRRQDHKWA